MHQSQVKKHPSVGKGLLERRSENCVKVEKRSTVAAKQRIEKLDNQNFINL